MYKTKSRTKSKSPTRTKSKSIRSKSKTRTPSRGKTTRAKSKSRSPARSKTVRVKSKSRSPTRKPKISTSLFDIRPVCSMGVQFFNSLTKRDTYVEHSDEVKGKLTSKHYGQRKLFMTELYFLAMYGHLSNTVLYIGSAPGNHLNILLQLFPNHTFILYDSRPFGLKQTDKCIIRQKYFTDDECTEFIGKNVLFISDIRREGFVENTIIEDMDMQKRWIHIMKPVMSMLKFRMPFTTGDYCKEPFSLQKDCTLSYLDGDLLLQPWAPHFSTEMRLVVPQVPKMKEYDIKEIDEKMYYFNNTIRNTLISFKDRNYTWDYMQECAIIRLFKIKYPKYAHVNISGLCNKFLYSETPVKI